MKVFIRKAPLEKEIDGVKLDVMAPGRVREVSPSIASWLIAEGYAEPEMRSTAGDDHSARNRESADDSQTQHRRRDDR